MDYVDYTDRPVIHATPKDPLHFDRYCRILTEVICTTKTPVTIGIFGPWGSGKTSLMRMVEDSLREMQQEGHPKVLSAWFNAWQYNRDRALWRALLLCVLNALRTSQVHDDEHLDDLDRLEQSLYQKVEWKELGPWTVDWAKAIQGTVEGAVDLALTFVPGAASLIKLLRDAKNVVSDSEREAITKAFQRKTIEYHRHQMRSMEQFQQGFREVLKSVTSDKQRLVIFVDDLDRCVPEKAIQVLEAIKLFLDAPGCIFVLGADRDVIEKGIRVKYQSFLLGPEEQLAEEDLLRRIPITGQDYMEKIVQLPFSLPPLRYEQVEAFVASLLSEHLSRCAPVFARGLEANPRKIKRGIHVFHMLHRLAKVQNITDLDPMLLAKMVIIQSRYRGLYADILQDSSLLKKLEQFALSKGELPVLSEAGKSDLSEQGARLRLRWMLAGAPYFENLDTEQFELYLYLTRAMSEEREAVTGEVEPAADEMRQQLRQDLLSNNMDWIQDAVDGIRVAKEEGAYALRLLEELRGDDLMPAARRSIGIALALLGDPRDFDEMVQAPEKDFCMGKFPITNGQFRHFIEAGGYTRRDYWEDRGWQWVSASQVRQPLAWDNPDWDQGAIDNHPVTGVNWYEARAYCAWLSERDGTTHCLPTVAEWLLTAQGDSNRTYPWGDKFELSRANTLESNLQTATAVGLYPGGASPGGVLGMAGNVWEWTDSEGDRPGTKLLKGGSWCDSADEARCEADNAVLPAFRDLSIGFRVLWRCH